MKFPGQRMRYYTQRHGPLPPTSPPCGNCQGVIVKGRGEMNDSEVFGAGIASSLHDEKMVVQLTVAELRIIVAEEIRKALVVDSAYVKGTDKLLAPEEAAAILGQTVRWLYRHCDKLPFTRRLSRKSLRFSEAGLHRWVAAKKPPSSR